MNFENGIGEILMDFIGIIGLLISIIIGVLTVIGVVRLAASYASGDSKGSKKEIKYCVIVCFCLGLLPGLGPIAINAGIAVVKPVNAIVNSVSHQSGKRSYKISRR
ncbi:hypothetical protein MK805_06310 [Shimazuella sp. AN120528]|uniref:hypothetical protein n=1 Tax=Shimazuella soli TaxID=1892854 RepID=UPI001F0FB794|nr:hypothetical protein [Shimazuella soli]MCH5584581.1 hypothetical protein [Shimazuella soli]